MLESTVGVPSIGKSILIPKIFVDFFLIYFDTISFIFKCVNRKRIVIIKKRHTFQIYVV